MELGAEIVRGSGFGFGGRSLSSQVQCRRLKDGAVARGVILTQTPHLLVRKLRLDHPHRHQNARSNSSSHKKSSYDLRRSDMYMTVERFVYKNVFSKVT